MTDTLPTREEWEEILALDMNEYPYSPKAVECRHKQLLSIIDAYGEAVRKMVDMEWVVSSSWGTVKDAEKRERTVKKLRSLADRFGRKP